MDTGIQTNSPGALTPPPPPPFGPVTPLSWRLALAGGILVLLLVAWLAGPLIGLRGRALLGIVCFIGTAALFSRCLQRLRVRVVAWGFLLQLTLALLVLKLEIGGVRPGYEVLHWVGGGVRKFLEFTDSGSRFVFGGLADQEAMNRVFAGKGFVFAFSALPAIVFVSSFFTVLYHFGVLQLLVRLMARGMMFLMGTSGAETLSATANVFMGQTEAPLIVRPFVPRMTESELLALMIGGMATISGGVMAVYINMGADPVAILATSVMAAPCGLYVAKILIPEVEVPQTHGEATVVVEKEHRNAIDAAAAGASEGLKLALNIAAMLIAFLAFLALIDFGLGVCAGWLSWWTGAAVELSLAKLFGWAFSPVALLMGVEGKDLAGVGDLLGTKLAANEFVAYVKLTEEYREELSPRSYALATYALTGFANFASVGIQLGGIGAMAPERRSDLARLGTRALLGGFLTTLVNASLAGVLM